jgi:hypothetical protein
VKLVAKSRRRKQNRQFRTNGGTHHLRRILELQAVQELIARLDGTRQTGRPGYPVGVMVAGLIARFLYRIPTITALVDLLRDHGDLREACGISSPEQVPSIDAFYRFHRKLRELGLLSEINAQLVDEIKAKVPDLGTDVAVDSTDVEAWCNTLRRTLRDRDAAWGYRNFGPDGKKELYYGYKVHTMVCADHQIPLAWKVTPANSNDGPNGRDPFGLAKADHEWFDPSHGMMDKGYDAVETYRMLEEDFECRPVIPLRDVKSESPLLDKQGHPFCEIGSWHYAGTDYKHKRTKWRCPFWKDKGCCPDHHLCTRSQNGKTCWLSANGNYRKHTLVPRGTPTFSALYGKRTSVKREFSLAKDQYMLTTLRAQGIERVRLHVEMSIFVRLAKALSELPRRNGAHSPALPSALPALTFPHVLSLASRPTRP